MFRKVYSIVLAITFLLSSMSGFVADAATPQLIVHFIDVGQGDSEFIQLPNGQTMLIDAGEANQGQNVVAYIKSLGVDKLDYIVATHPHSDHIGGLPAVINALPIGKIYAPEFADDSLQYKAFSEALKSKKLSITTVKAPMLLVQTNNLNIGFVAPQSSHYTELNDWSIVTRVQYGANSFLFTGDAEHDSESEMLVESSHSLKADVLKIGCHGSCSSTSAGFLKMVAPKYAVISVSTKNDSKLPNKEILDKLTSAHVTMYQTNINGTIVMNSDGKTITTTLKTNVQPSAQSAQISDLSMKNEVTKGSKSWISDTAKIAIESSMLAITAKGTTGGGGCTITTTPGHLYYYAVTLKGATANKNYIMIEGKSDTCQFTIGSGTQRLSNVFKATATTHRLMALDYRKSGWTKFYLDLSDLVVIDLTQRFGAGYEPSPSWCDTYITTTGSVSTKDSGLSTDINDYITYPVASTIPETIYNVTDYGAKGDGRTDDTTAINTAVAKANAAGGGTVYIPDGTYLINVDDAVGIDLRSNIKLHLADNAILQAKATNAGTYGIIRIVSRTNVEIYGGRIIGDLDTHLGTTGEWGSGIELYNSSNIHIHDIQISNTWGDCIYLGGSSQKTYNQNVLIENFKLDYPGRNGISVISAKNLVIQNGSISNALHTAPNGIDVEPNYNTEWSYNILLKNVTVDNAKGYGLSYGGPRNLKDTKNPVHITLDHFAGTNCGKGVYRNVFMNNFVAQAPAIFRFEFIN